MIRIFQGVDIVELDKFERIFLNNKDFISDIFTDQEKGYCFSKHESIIHFAVCFAAKEASLKALGIGLFNLGIGHVFKEIEVAPDVCGRPILSFSGWAEKICKKRQISQFFLSISHSSYHALALVILTGTQE